MISFYIIATLICLSATIIILWPALRLPIDRRPALLLAALLTVSALGIYSMLGAPRIIPLLAEHEARLADITKRIGSASDLIKSDPENIDAWISLGESFMMTGQYDAAVNAFKQTVLLSHGAPALIMAYAKALIAAADGKVTDDAATSLNMVLLQEPQHEEARYYLAVRQLQNDNTTEAMHMMKSLYRSLPDDSPLKSQIDKQIGRK